jgi:hypothetical protein
MYALQVGQTNEGIVEVARGVATLTLGLRPKQGLAKV